MIDDPGMQAKGLFKQAEGKAQQALGKVSEGLRKFKEDRERESMMGRGGGAPPQGVSRASGANIASHRRGAAMPISSKAVSARLSPCRSSST
ncbi:MAG: CsbD family protein [Candidatus Xenobia bacterium]